MATARDQGQIVTNGTVPENSPASTSDALTAKDKSIFRRGHGGL